MKKLILLTITLLSVFVSVIAQKKEPKPKTSFGILGAGNYTKFRVESYTPNSYTAAGGGAFGVWLNIPINSFVSIEPQAQYSYLRYVSNNTSPSLKLFDGIMQYQSYPVFVKIKANKDFSFILGPQFDFLNKITNNSAAKDILYKGQFRSQTITWTAGVELFPDCFVQPYIRYMYGTQNLASGSYPSNEPNLFNRGIQAGFKFRLTKVAKVAPVPAPVVTPPVVVEPPKPKDTDGDGITDDVDKCPTVPGVAKYGGCPVPDTDGDGINDENDKCPTVPGLAKYGGCPIPDTDKDGINDEEDKCPTVPGLAKYNGCPIPDTDGDGVNDEEDKCPTVKGTVTNAGCPELAAQYKFDNKKVLFNTGTAVLTKASKVELEKVVKALNDYPSLKLYVDGHTDNSGSDKVNVPLSLKRANAVKAYLFSRKIDAARLVTDGFGSSKPIADNKTAKGKALNRRVEFRVQE
ncbi:MAG: OmpA family protein [Sediminibacterium sp.]|jgi:outer membrane protein OmpA-like peptidoglycan-associated protein|nr:OmpA family protein [Chitinophagaceae bacterium]MCA6447054.1 OmpA family protein [Chitinophagaceae bacterium]